MRSKKGSLYEKPGKQNPNFRDAYVSFVFAGLSVKYLHNTRGTCKIGDSTKLNLLKCLTRLLKFDHDLHKHTHKSGAMLGDVHFDQVEESRDSFVSTRVTDVQAKPSGTPSRKDSKLM